MQCAVAVASVVAGMLLSADQNIDDERFGGANARMQFPESSFPITKNREENRETGKCIKSGGFRVFPLPVNRSDVRIRTAVRG